MMLNLKELLVSLRHFPVRCVLVHARTKSWQVSPAQNKMGDSPAKRGFKTFCCSQSRHSYAYAMDITALPAIRPCFDLHCCYIFPWYGLSDQGPVYWSRLSPSSAAVSHISSWPFLVIQLHAVVQDDGTFGDDGDDAAVAASPGSVSLGTDSSEDEDDEDGDAGEHRMNVRTGQPQLHFTTLPHLVLFMLLLMQPWLLAYGWGPCQSGRNM